MTAQKLGSIAVLGAMLSSCANPASVIQTDIDEFKRDHSDHILTRERNRRSIRFAWTGDPLKRPLIFVHGSPGSWENWAHFLNNSELQSQYQVFSVDRPGYGGSGKGTTEHSLAAQATDILSILELNQSNLPAVMVGHSFGGPVIARAAMDHPEKVGALVFVASSVDPKLEEKKWMQSVADTWPIRHLIPSSLKVCNEEIMTLKDELTLMLPLWKSVKAPYIIIQGDEDELVPPANADFLIQQLPPQKLRALFRVQGLNHFVPWKRPDLILDAIRNVLKEEKK